VDVLQSHERLTICRRLLAVRQKGLRRVVLGSFARWLPAILLLLLLLLPAVLCTERIVVGYALLPGVWNHVARRGSRAYKSSTSASWTARGVRIVPRRKLFSTETVLGKKASRLASTLIIHPKR
jgi:hypothetical protein